MASNRLFHLSYNSINCQTEHTINLNLKKLKKEMEAAQKKLHDALQAQKKCDTHKKAILAHLDTIITLPNMPSQHSFLQNLLITEIDEIKDFEKKISPIIEELSQFYQEKENKYYAYKNLINKRNELKNNIQKFHPEEINFNKYTLRDDQEELESIEKQLLGTDKPLPQIRAKM